VLGASLRRRRIVQTVQSNHYKYMVLIKVIAIDLFSMVRESTFITPRRGGGGEGYLKTEIGFEYNHQGRSKPSDVWGGGYRRIIRVIIIIKLFLIDWHSHTNYY
jgi:hypothetical protein